MRNAGLRDLPTHPPETLEATGRKALTDGALGTPVARPNGGLRDFLEIPYEQLEEMNLEAKSQRLTRTAPEKVRELRLKYLTDERRIKALTVCFADLEGRLHMLDYDKKFLLKAHDNLTFDGSSIRGFSQQAAQPRGRLT